jgi:hypothetical protein
VKRRTKEEKHEAGVRTGATGCKDRRLPAQLQNPCNVCSLWCISGSFKVLYISKISQNRVTAAQGTKTGEYEDDKHVGRQLRMHAALKVIEDRNNKQLSQQGGLAPTSSIHCVEALALHSQDQSKYLTLCVSGHTWAELVMVVNSRSSLYVE